MKNGTLKDRMGPCRNVEAQGPILSFRVPFVKIGAAYWTLPGDNFTSNRIMQIKGYNQKASNLHTLDIFSGKLRGPVKPKSA